MFPVITHTKIRPILILVIAMNVLGSPFFHEHIGDSDGFPVIMLRCHRGALPCASVGKKSVLGSFHRLWSRAVIGPLVGWTVG